MFIKEEPGYSWRRNSQGRERTKPLERTGRNSSRALGITGWEKKKTLENDFFYLKLLLLPLAEWEKQAQNQSRFQRGLRNCKFRKIWAGKSQAQRVGNSQLEKEAGDSQESKLTLRAVLPSRNAERFGEIKGGEALERQGRGSGHFWDRDLSPKIPGWSSVPARSMAGAAPSCRVIPAPNRCPEILKSSEFSLCQSCLGIAALSTTGEPREERRQGRRGEPS